MSPRAALFLLLAASLNAQSTPAVTTGAILPDGSVGVAYQVVFSADGGVPPHRFVLRSGLLPSGLFFNPLGILSGSPAVPGVYQFDVAATDTTGTASEPKTFLMDVYGALRIQTPALPAAIESLPYSVTLRATGGMKPYQWIANDLHPGLSLQPLLNDSSRAVLSGTPFGPTLSSGTPISVIVRDTAGDTDRRVFPLVVYDSSLRVVTNSLPRGRTGQRFNQTIRIGGGAPPYTCRLNTALRLPRSLELDPVTCVLSGLAREGTAQQVEIDVRDSTGLTVTGRFQLVVDEPDLRVATYLLPDATEGVALPATQLQAEGGSGEYVWRAAGLPGGLQLSADGVLSGTARSAGTVDTVLLAITDRNVTDRATSQVFSMTVRPRGTLTIQSASSLPAAVLNQEYRMVLEAVDGRPPHRWSLSGVRPAVPIAPLPPGLDLDPDTGILAGRPTQFGTFTFRVQAADLDGSDARDFTIDVRVPPPVTREGTFVGVIAP